MKNTKVLNGVIFE